MKNKLLLSILALLFFASGYAQQFWFPTSSQRLQGLEKVERTSMVYTSSLFNLNLEQMKQKLQFAPSRNSGVESTIVIDFPDANGKLKQFKIYEASVMHPVLAAKYDGLQTYVGQGVTNPNEVIRISTTVFGLHAMTFTDQGVQYIDPYTKDLQNYIVYKKQDVTSKITRECLVEDGLSENDMQNITVNAKISDGKFRTYRLAMACTIEYAAFHINQAGLNSGTLAEKKAAVLSAMVVSMERLNGVYERELSLEMQLVANNDEIIFITTDNFNNTNAGILINQSQTVIDSIIGFDNYDIGHTVSTGGGGLAQKPSVCTTGKARGITGSSSPVGDPFDIDYVAHEMGHQFGADHTFNGLGGSCSTGTRSSGYSVEPGSGSTIMAYAGICAPVNVQNHSDSFFHAVSLAQMANHINSAGNCAVQITNGNLAPVVNAGANYTIPNGTAFVLNGTATDSNNATLTYSWEQTNNTISPQPPVSTSTGGPNFRSFAPSLSGERYMPRFQDVLTNNLSPTWEVVPTVARTMNFALTVRDNEAINGGQTARDNMSVTFSSVGPFKVTSQNEPQLVMASGSTQTITWDVAGTTANNINTSLVNIVLISTQEGSSFSMVLAANTPNDGSEVITIPNIISPNCRIKVEAVGNIYYALNASNIAIGPYSYEQVDVCNDYVLEGPILIEENDISYAGYALNVPESFIISDVNINPVFTHPNVGELYFGIRPPSQNSGLIRMSSGSCSGSADLDLVYDSQGTAINCSNTTSGAATLPQDTFNVMNGQQANGEWVFFMTDINVDGDSGTLNSLTLTLCSSTLAPVLKTEKFGLSNFALYPNPNTGTFSVAFNSDSGEAISVNVHDIQGRQILSKQLANTGNVSEVIALPNVQAGIYLVTVQDGNKKEVKRVIVQ